MQSIRCGQVTIFYDLVSLARGGKARMRFHHQNGECTDVDVLAFDVFGVMLKFTAEVNQRVDVLQREMEKAEA